MPLFYTASGFNKALIQGDIVTLEKYLARDKQKWMAWRRENDLSSALHIAAAHGREELVEKLIEEGASVNEKNIAGLSPLAMATAGQHYEAMETLLEEGADVNVNAADGRTLLDSAIENYFPSGTQLLLKYKPDLAKGDPLALALGNRDTDTLGALVIAGLVDGKKEKIQELFGYFLEYNSPDMARIMLGKGADVNAPDHDGNLPLNAAVYHNNPDLFNLLLEKGADINAQNNQGFTPLHSAIYFDRKDMFNALIAKNVRTDIKDRDGQTAVEMAERHSRSAMLKFLKKEEEKKLAKEVSPLNATKTRMPDGNAETWVLMSYSEVARVSVSPALGRRLTHIFNFESRERIIISENLKTGVENVTPPEKFETLEDAHLARALMKFRELGGKVDDDAVFGGKRLDKKHMPGLGS